jgi:glc operon protein GlcG
MKSIAIAVLALLVSAAGATSRAQLTQKQALTLDGAKKVMAAAEAEAKRQSFPCSIAIVDDGGNLLLMERLDDWIVASANVSVGKARTSAIFRRPTSDFENIIKNGRTAMVALNDFTPLQGGVPITVDGKVVGAIGVSGNNPPKDEEIALAGANALGGSATIVPTSATSTTPMGSVGATGMASAGPSDVSFFSKKQVDEGFAKGAVLFDGAGRNYMVHTSRREKPGMAEVHSLDTDVIYVLEGAATFVTGGTVVDGATTAPNEIRGSSIQGGETRRITEGDVVIVPHGVPHWFKDVRAPLLYYVVKVS